MPSSIVIALALIVARLPTLAPRAAAQPAPATPNHKHSERPAGDDEQPAPGMPLAPRLQNLGVHTFLVATKVARAFAEAARLAPDAQPTSAASRRQH